MSTMRLTGPSQHIDIEYHARLTGAQRMAGLARASSCLGASAAQAFGAMCTLPLLPTGAPLWFGLRAASNLRSGLCTLGHAALGTPAASEAIDGAVLSALCADVLHMCEVGAAKRGCEAAAQLLSMETVELGTWRAEVIDALCEGVQRAANEAVAEARASCDELAAERSLSETRAWINSMHASVQGGLPWDTRFEAVHRIDNAFAAERTWWRLAAAYRHAIDAEDRGQGVEAMRLLEGVLRDPRHLDEPRALPAREMLARLQTAHVGAWRQTMDAAVAVDDWRAAQSAAENIVGLVSGIDAFAPDVDAASAVRAMARVLIGESVPTFEALEAALHATGMDASWRLKQVDEARTLLGPADNPLYPTLADEIIMTFQPPRNIDHPRVIHARLPNLFYHPEANRHGPYIKLVPQAMLAAFAQARQRDHDDSGMHAQREFFSGAFVDLCFEGRADHMMRYLVAHPLDPAHAVDAEAVLDLRDGMDDEARATEHFRVYSLVQLRRYAATRGVDVKDTDAFSAVRAQLEAEVEYTRDYCNAERFGRYLMKQDFVREHPKPDEQATRLVAYLSAIVGVL